MGPSVTRGGGKGPGSRVIGKYRTMTERIEITSVGEHTYAVTLRSAGATTHHEVVVPAALATALGLGPHDDKRLVRASFEFLLEREPATSILRSFDLDVIGRYFPEYVSTVRDQLGSATP
jgi:hypothetical protein